MKINLLSVTFAILGQEVAVILNSQFQHKVVILCKISCDFAKVHIFLQKVAKLHFSKNITKVSML